MKEALDFFVRLLGMRCVRYVDLTGAPFREVAPGRWRLVQADEAPS
jgi:hypothetical protein